MAHNVFISYAKEDRQVAVFVCDELECVGVKCWIAPRDVNFGESYEQAILDAIEASRFFVLIFSAHSNSSQHVQREIRKAFEEGSSTEVFPFRLEDIPYNKVLDYYLSGTQWVYACSPPLKSGIQLSGIQLLVRHVRNRLDGELSGIGESGIA
jgi:hypothetical protein